MQIEAEIIESVISLLQSRDRDNHILVASILEITAEDLTEETIASNIEKILVLTNHIIAEKKRTDDPAYPVQYNAQFIAEQVYDKLIFGTFQRAEHIKKSDPFVFFSKLSYETELYDKNKKRF